MTTSNVKYKNSWLAAGVSCATSERAMLYLYFNYDNSVVFYGDSPGTGTLNPDVYSTGFVSSDLDLDQLLGKTGDWTLTVTAPRAINVMIKNGSNVLAEFSGNTNYDCNVGGKASGGGWFSLTRDNK